MLWGPGLTLLLLNAQPNLQTSAALAQLAKELNHRRPKGHKNDGWQNKYCQGDYHFNRSFGCVLLSPMTAFRSQRLRVHAQRRSDACAEAVSLDERSDQSPNLVNAGATAVISQRLRARLAGPHLEIHKIKFIAQIGMRVLEIFPDAHKRLIEGKTDLHADDREIKRIGQRDRDATLAVFDHALQHETGTKNPKPPTPIISRRSKPCSTATTPSIPTKASSMRLPTYIVRWRGSR